MAPIQRTYSFGKGSKSTSSRTADGQLLRRVKVIVPKLAKDGDTITLDTCIGCFKFDVSEREAGKSKDVCLPLMENERDKEITVNRVLLNSGESG